MRGRLRVGNKQDQPSLPPLLFPYLFRITSGGWTSGETWGDEGNDSGVLVKTIRESRNGHGGEGVVLLVSQ